MSKPEISIEDEFDEDDYIVRIAVDDNEIQVRVPKYLRSDPSDEWYGLNLVTGGHYE